jgi:hypothetical protein
MLSSSEPERILQTALAGIPAAAKQIGAIPAERRAPVLLAAELGYVQMALALGYAEEAARLWASVVTSQLRIEAEKYRWAIRMKLKLLYREAIRAGFQDEESEDYVVMDLDEPVSVRDDSLARGTYFCASPPVAYSSEQST